ncbi:MAG: Copper ion binding protein [Actinomycetota bacterium]|jgi:Cu+-exporting ATPase
MATEKILKIEGMTCNHCVMSVTKELSKLPGAKDVAVDLASASAHLSTDESVTEAQLAEAIDEAGYKLVSVA